SMNSLACSFSCLLSFSIYCDERRQTLRSKFLSSCFSDKVLSGQKRDISLAEFGRGGHYLMTKFGEAIVIGFRHSVNQVMGFQQRQPTSDATGKLALLHGISGWREE